MSAHTAARSVHDPSLAHQDGRSGRRAWGQQVACCKPGSLPCVMKRGARVEGIIPAGKYHRISTHIMHGPALGFPEVCECARHACPRCRYPLPAHGFHLDLWRCAGRFRPLVFPPYELRPWCAERKRQCRVLRSSLPGGGAASTRSGSGSGQRRVLPKANPGFCAIAFKKRTGTKRLGRDAPASSGAGSGVGAEGRGRSHKTPNRAK